jgi:hypothetical protein
MSSIRGTREEQVKFDRDLRKHDRSIRDILQEKGFDMKALTEFTIHNMMRETLICAQDTQLPIQDGADALSSEQEPYFAMCMKNAVMLNATLNQDSTLRKAYLNF